MTRIEFLKQIEMFISHHFMKPTTFGRKALGQPMFVFQLRLGRECRETTQEKVLTFMRNYKE